MKNKKTMALISGAVGVCMLTTAAVASYQTPNGYDALKKSILGTMDYTNCTVSASMSMELDGSEIMKMNGLHELALDSNITHTSSSFALAGENPYRADVYYCGDKEYSLAQSTNPSAGDNEYYSCAYPHTKPNLWDIEPEDRETADKIIRFMELASDTIVGDLRNNFVCTDDSDDSTSYSLTLDSVQIPELVNAGLSMLFSMENSYAQRTVVYTDENGNTVTEDVDRSQDPSDGTYYTAIMGNDPILDSMMMDYTVNEDGTFRDGTISVVFTGNGHTMMFNISCNISDVGTTSIATPQEQGFKITEMSYDDYTETEEAVTEQ
ncbi:MAG: hypothetical protein PUD92_06845 [Clostridiales bacterium]|nr:hypothetical protein [Clostridiales bacterium]